MAPTVRADLDGSVHVTNELGRRVVLTAGQVVPDGYRVGDHLLEQAEASAPAEDGYLADDHTVDEVLAYVGDDPVRAGLVLSQERDGKGRVTLVAELERIAGSGS